MPPAAPLFVLISGRPGSGKSTLAAQLSQHLGLPWFGKDFFKDLMFDTLGARDRAWSRAVGGAAHRILCATLERTLGAKQGVIIESNFRPQADTAYFEGVLARFGCAAVQVHCLANPEILWTRFESRATSEDRHPGHADAANLTEFKDAIFAPGTDKLLLSAPLLECDTTNPTLVDAVALAAQIKVLASFITHKPSGAFAQ